MNALAITEIVPRRFGHLRHSAKTLARMSGATERAAKNWLAGRNAPQMEHCIKLAAECDDFLADLLALIEQAKEKIR